MRHSASHVMAEAVMSIFPETRFGIGPAIEDGFYYDFDLPRTLTPEDLPVIEQKMSEIIKADLPFTHRDVTKEEARQLFHELEQQAEQGASEAPCSELQTRVDQ